MLEECPQPKVAYLKFSFLPPSESYIAQQLAALRRYDPLVLAMSAPDATGLPEATIRSLSTLNPFARAYNGLSLRLRRTCPHFEVQARREGCRLLHALSGVEGIYGARLKARTRLPLVTTFRGADVTRLPRRNRRLYERLFAEGDLFLAPAEAVRKELLGLGCPENRVRIHRPGIDVERIPFHEREPGEGGSVNVLVVGRMVERKGLPYGLQAFANASRYHRHVSLTLIGDGPARPAVEAQLRELNLANVRLLGAQPHDVVLAEMQKAHIFVLPSVTTADGDTEGIPIALIEAQASGLPVVTTWHSGIPELVADGQNGYLVSERNSHALAERLRNLIEHPELWSSFGRAGRAIVEQSFSLRRQVAGLEEYYDELLDGETDG